jgi:hypothetical protein
MRSRCSQIQEPTPKRAAKSALPQASRRDFHAEEADTQSSSARFSWSLENTSFKGAGGGAAAETKTPPLPLQPKLLIGAVDDPLEREADRKCTKCEEEEEKLQKKEGGAAEVTSGEAPASVHEVLRSPGQPLDAATRAYFEPRFRYDFSKVRVHTDAAAEQSARDVNARAYTVGQSIVFSAGRFAPAAHEGRQLLAHELTHVVQQGSIGNLSPSLRRSPDDGPPAAPSAASAKFFDPSRGPLTADEKQKLLRLREKFKLPVQPTEGDTSIVGILVLETGEELEFHSGEFGSYHAGVRRAEIPRGPGSGATRYNRTHVETLAAQAMRKRSIKRAILLIEKEPCAVCGGYQKGMPEEETKTPLAAKVLAEDSQLLVVDGDYVTYFRSTRAAPSPKPPPPKAPAKAEPAEPTKTEPTKKVEPPKTAKVGPAAPPKTEPAKEPTAKTIPPPKTEPPAAGGPKVSTQKAKNLDFQTRGKIIYTEGRAEPHAEMRSATPTKPELLGEGLAQVLPEAMSALQDETIQNAVARQMMGNWRTLEQWRFNQYPNDWILCVVSLEEWEQPDPAGQVARMVNYVKFFHGPTQQDALTQAESVYRSGVEKGWREVGPFLGWIAPSDSLDEAKKLVQSKKWCFIATACYNSQLAPEVCLLREFRDVVLKRSRLGRVFIRIYYRVSPPIAVFLARHAWPRALVRNLLLMPLVAIIRCSRGRWWRGSLARSPKLET